MEEHDKKVMEGLNAIIALLVFIVAVITIVIIIQI